MNNSKPDQPARKVQPDQPAPVDLDGPHPVDAADISGDVPLEDLPVGLKPAWGPASWFRLALVLLALVIAGLALMRWIGS